MNHHQDMSKQLGRTQLSATARLSLLQRRGHQVNLEGDANHATATITRSEGSVHRITITPEELPENTRNGAPYGKYPQNVLMAYAIHAIADWSANIDRTTTAPCTSCGTTISLAANYNQQDDTYDWYCANCFYADTEEAN